MVRKNFFAIIFISAIFCLLPAFCPIEWAGAGTGIGTGTGTETGTETEIERWTGIELGTGMGLFAAKTVYASAIEQNGAEAEEIKVVMSTEQAVAYTFSGIINRTVTQDVLAKLHKLGIHATFFVTESEIKDQPETIQAIIAGGNELGIAVRPRNGAGVDETYRQLLRVQKLLKEQFDVDTNLVKQPYGALTGNTKTAVKKAGFILIGHTVNVVQSKHKNYTSAEQIMPEIFGKAIYSLSRGQIVHFRMDYYTHDYLVGQLMEIIKQRKLDNIAYEASYDNPDINPANNSRYTIKPVGPMLANKKFIYKYPVSEQDIPPELKPDAPRLDISDKNFMTEATKRYIGNVNVNYENAIIGFSKREAMRLDKTGLIPTKENIIFLTFDDWGSDSAVNRLLYVLRKHNVKATFFILTNNVLINTNLLRAIAEEGHEIANHSDKHRPMAFYDIKKRRYVPVQTKEEYTEELALSYKKLADVVGDVTYLYEKETKARPVLHRYFRPPTLAISRQGFEAIFANNFEYIVSGSFSTGDYAAKDIPECLAVIQEGILTPDNQVIKGAILIMHFSDTALYTPMALDILLSANTAKDDSDPSKFKVGMLSDYLKEGYSQIAPRK